MPPSSSPDAAKNIPSKLFFKIGEVCEITETQPYVLRYWESEFPSLAPAKNNSGQRIYRRRDIETILRIKTLLYEEGFTIAGAKKKLEQELKEGGKKKTPTGEVDVSSEPAAPNEALNEQVDAVKSELRDILDVFSDNDAKLDAS